MVLVVDCDRIKEYKRDLYGAKLSVCLYVFVCFVCLCLCLFVFCFLFIIPYSDRKGFVPTLNLTVITSNSSTSSYPSALPTIQVHLELDGRTLEIVHCFYNVVRHFFFTLKSRHFTNYDVSLNHLYEPSISF